MKVVQKAVSSKEAAEIDIDDVHQHFRWVWPLLRDCGFLEGIQQHCKIEVCPADYMVFWILGQLSVLHPDVRPDTHSPHRAWEKAMPLAQKLLGVDGKGRTTNSRPGSPIWY